MRIPITLSIFLPTYNEEKNIPETIERAVAVVEHSPFIRDYEIIIVNDGSTDRTPKLAGELRARFKKLRLISHERNMGYGVALRTGIAAAKMEYVFFTDADLQFDLVELQHLLLFVPD